MKPRLALVTHVDWGHIRQRPHQLAVALTAHFDVTVMSPVARKRGHLVTNPAHGVKLVRVWRLPGSYRSAGVAKLNGLLAASQCGPQVREASVVVVTSPELWPWVAPALDRRTLVYDCMDDALAFAQDPGVRDAKVQWESALLDRADALVCTTDELAARSIGRGARRDRTFTLPNGWDPMAFPLSPSSALPAHGPIELAYFGTIGPWLDVDALRAIADADSTTSIRLIGPVDQVDITGVSRVRVEAPVAHDALAAAVARTDVLLLPFRVDELTRAVDPVKLYEYIALGKPILASHWAALDRFAPFVTFYRDTAELSRCIRTRALATPPDVPTRERFLAPQSWSSRAEAFAGIVERAGRARRSY